MFDTLEPIEALDPPVDDVALVQLLALQDRLAAKVSQAVAEVDAAKLWDLDGSVSMTAWLRNRAGMSNREAARVAGTARRLRRCPHTAAAWVDGRLSGGQVAAVVANVTDRTADLFWHWEDGGPTRLDNLVLLCTRHHHRCHLPGWQIKLLPRAATVEVTDRTAAPGPATRRCSAEVYSPAPMSARAPHRLHR